MITRCVWAGVVPRRLAAVLLVLAAGLFFAGCAPKRENVLLIVVDALRADRLGCYGHDRPTSPCIDRLAKRGVLFENAYSTAPWTVPSTASLMTSLHAREHGCRHGYVAEDGVADQEILADEFETLAERMKALGYRTYGVSANPHISKAMGFMQGFDVFKTLWLADSPAVNEVIGKWAGDLRKKSRKPWFLYIHYFDPHMPYVGREPWISTFSEGRTGHRVFDGLDHPNLARVFGNEMRRLSGDRGMQQRYVKKTRVALLDLYDSEIRYQDQHIQEMLETLGVDLDRTTVILTSDHGEEFFEHGNITGHGRSLYEASVHIPLIWSGPQVKTVPGTRIRTPISHTDIYPTLMALNDGTIPAGICGFSFAKTLATGAEPEDRTLYFETEREPEVTFLGLRDGPWKFITKGGLGDGAQYKLLNLETDPGEEGNLAHAQREITARFLEHLKTWSQDHPPRDAERSRARLDEKQLQELRSLGYLK